MNSKYIPTFPQSLRITRFLLSLIIASVLGSSFRTDDLWSQASVHSSQFMMFTAVATMLYDCYSFFTSVDTKSHDCTVSKRYKIGHSIAEGLISIFWWSALASSITALEGWVKVQAKLDEFEWGRSRVVGSLALAGMVGALSTATWINISYQAIRV